MMTDDYIELNSSDNYTKAEEVIRLINAMTAVRDVRIENLKGYIARCEQRIAIQRIEVGKMYEYLREIEVVTNG